MGLSDLFPLLCFIGERLDSVDYGWVEKSPRPYDPPLTELGKKQAKDVAKYFEDKVSNKLTSRARCAVVSPAISLAGHTLSQERVWYFTMQRFVPDPTTFVGCFPPNVYVVCVLRDRVYTLQPLSARTIICTVTYQTLS